MITLSITTCKRFNLFNIMINSLANTCLDLNLISEVILVDDNSSVEDRSRMVNIINKVFLNKTLKFYFKSKEESGHPVSLNIIRTLTKNRYLFQNEDDWIFCEKDKYIGKSLKILESNKDIAIVSLRDISDDGYRSIFNQYNENNVDNIYFKIHNQPGFTLNPSIHDLQKIKNNMENIYFDITNSEKIEYGFENEFSKKYHDSGLRTAFFSRNKYIRNIGNISAYYINKSKR